MPSEPRGSALPSLASLVLELREEVSKLREAVHTMEVEAAKMGVTAMKTEIDKADIRLTALEKYQSEQKGSFRLANIIWGALWSLVIILVAWRLK